MAKNRMESDDILNRMTSQIDDLNDLEDQPPAGEDKPAGKQAKAPASFKFGDKEIPADQVNTFVAEQFSKLEEQGNELARMKQGIVDAVGGKKEETGFNEIKFLSDPKYREDYLNGLVEQKVGKQQKEVSEALQKQQEQFGEIKLNGIKNEVMQELDRQDIPFDFKKNEKKIEAIALEHFNPEYIRNNTKKVLMYAVNKIIGGKLIDNGDGYDIEAPSGYMAGGRKASPDEEVKSRIMNAVPDGTDEDSGKSVFL